MAHSIAVAVKEMYEILNRDRTNHLVKIDEYIHGIQDRPYTPPQADAEFDALGDRCITNLVVMPINSVSQGLAVDGYRPGAAHAAKGDKDSKAIVASSQWDFWQRSRLDARQGPLYRGALGYGHSFLLTYKKADGKAYAKGLSALATTALFDDAANDESPTHALSLTRFAGRGLPAVGVAWDGTHQYDVSIDGDDYSITNAAPHGLVDECPVTRFAAAIDLEGRTVGVVEPLMPLQDRINQTVFDLLIAQTYGSFKVRTMTGMVPSMVQEPVYRYDEDGVTKTLDPLTGQPIILMWRPKIDPNTGRETPVPMSITAAKFLISEDPDTKFGQLDETPLAGYISSIKMSVQHFAALSQTPPHYMLGEIANVSAEALNAAEHSLTRLIGGFKDQFGESWERVFRQQCKLEGVAGGDDFSGEVLWRELGSTAFAQVADGLGKAAQSLQIPRRGLWARFPNVTQNELATWERMWEEDNALAAQSANLSRAGVSAGTAPRITGYRERLTQPAAQAAAVTE